MPEHVHLLLAPIGGQTVPTILQKLKQPFAKRIVSRWRELNAPILSQVTSKGGSTHFWQRGGGYDRNIYSENELLEKIQYIHANPVQRGLVDHVQNWNWSSAKWYLSDRHGPVSIDSIMS